ncbi:MAG TPA: sigma-70 family RNA polymerase sigma factor [Microlunatus sp.]
MTAIDQSDDLNRARAGDDAAFERLVAPLRTELHAHGYRMLGSVHDADDALQDALLRAWRGLPGFRGQGSLRSWLYAVLTRTCLDAIGHRRSLPMDLSAPSAVVVEDQPRTDVAWLEPYPAELPGDHVEPGARYEQREAIEIAFVAALQQLPGNQRAALLMFDVLGYPAAEIAEIMGTSVSSVNSALQRARGTLTDRIPTSQQRIQQDAGSTRVQQLARTYAAAFHDRDLDRFLSLITDDVTWSMPPLPHWYQGRDRVSDFAATVPFGDCGDWRSEVITLNAQPAVAHYLDPDGSGVHSSWSITVLSLRHDKISELTSFIGHDHFRNAGLPLHWSGPPADGASDRSPGRHTT